MILCFCVYLYLYSKYNDYIYVSNLENVRIKYMGVIYAHTEWVSFFLQDSETHMYVLLSPLSIFLFSLSLSLSLSLYKGLDIRHVFNEYAYIAQIYIGVCTYSLNRNDI
jgi:hypothetical protein